MSRPARYAFSVMVLMLVLVATAGSSFAVAELAVSRSQRQWCDTLTMLTQVPVSPPGDPAKNPSREGQYRLYEDFVRVKGQFGC